MSIQQRLLQREPLDPWTIREQLCLASAVCRSGDQNWMSVSRQLKAAGDPTRPQDWYQQKYCAAQYGALLESAETPKRKKRVSEGAAETPQEAILKRLTAERIAELQRLMAEERAQYAVLKEEIAECRSPTTTDARLREMLVGVETVRRQREREQQRHTQFLRDREERKRAADKSRKLPVTPPAGGSLSPPASSPLLTSLLKNVTPGTSVSQMLHVPRPGSTLDAVSPSASAPTLSMLLEKGREGVVTTTAPAPTPVANESAVIEQIKSELQEIENNLRMANMVTSSTPVLPSIPAPLDIDDIEIKAEDVYAFSDVALEIQPVSAIHKHIAPRSVEKPPTPSRKEEVAETPDVVAESLATVVEESPAAFEATQHNEVVVLPEEVQFTGDPAVEALETVGAEETADFSVASSAETFAEDPPVIVPIPAPEESIPATEEGLVVPKEEEKSLQPETAEDDSPAADEDEEVNVTRVSEANTEPEETTQSNADDRTAEQHSTGDNSETNMDTESIKEEPVQETQPSAVEPSSVVDQPSAVEQLSAIESSTEADPSADEELPVEEVASLDAPVESVAVKIENEESERREETEATPAESAEVSELPVHKEPPSDKDPPSNKEPPSDEELPADAETPTNKGLPADTQPPVDTQQPPADTEHNETDDDTPMEVIREEEKGGRKRRDYSRRKTSLPYESSRGRSGSESAAESAPASPVATPAPPEHDREHRLWKKSVMLVYNRLCAHKYASLFTRPITDDMAPDYSLVVRRPMDLTTIKRNIDAGVIRTTAEFQRDVLLMLSNALFYNSSQHRVHHMAREMHEEAAAQLGMLLQAQAHAAMADSTAEGPVRRAHPSAITKRKRTSSPHLTASPAAKRVKEE